MGHLDSSSMSETNPKAARDNTANRAGLPIGKAFVVRFRAGDENEPELFQGRLDHVQSGRSGAFHSPAELQAQLLAFLHRASFEGEP